MVIAAFAVSLAALVLSGFSVWYSRKQAKIAHDVDRRARRPMLSIRLRETVSTDVSNALYFLRNEGGEDLDSVRLSRPRPDDGAVYRVAALGGQFADEIELGPLEMKAERGFLLAIGSAEQLPEFRVRITSRRQRDVWEDVFVLEDPRFHPFVY